MAVGLQRMGLGFLVGALSVLTFHAAAWEAFHVFGHMPAPFPVRPVPPLGVPQFVSLCFWGGVWGAAFGLLLPSMPAPVPMWLKGVGLGIAAALTGLLIVAPLKGLPIAAGGHLVPVLRSLCINGIWGLGVGLMLAWVVRSRGIARA